VNEQLIRSVVSRCAFPGFDFLVRRKDSVLFLQVQHAGKCNVTGEPKTWKGRKWLLSEHMVVGEIVQTAFLAIKAALEHEAREQFRYRGAMVFGPHFNVERLVSLANDPDAIEERTPPAEVA
jgi:hypothetical protein